MTSSHPLFTRSTVKINKLPWKQQHPHSGNECSAQVTFFLLHGDILTLNNNNTTSWHHVFFLQKHLEIFPVRCWTSLLYGWTGNSL